MRGFCLHKKYTEHNFMIRNSKQTLDIIIGGRSQPRPKIIIFHYLEISTLQYVTSKDISKVSLVVRPRKIGDD